MRNNIYNLMSFYLNLIVANYHAITRINSSIPLLRLVSEERSKKNGEIFFKIQVSGKNIFPIISLEDLRDPAKLSNFCKADQEIICSYFQKNKTGITKRIIAKTFDRVQKRFIYTIEFFDESTNIKKCINTGHLTQLIKDIKEFNNEDAFIIGMEFSKQ